MSAPNSEEVNTSSTGDETHGSGSHEVEDVGNAATSSCAPFTSEEVAPREGELACKSRIYFWLCVILWL